MKKLSIFTLCCIVSFVEGSDFQKSLKQKVKYNSSQPLQIPERKYTAATVSSYSPSPEFVQFNISPLSVSPLTGTYCLSQFVLNYHDEYSPRDTQ